MIQNSLGLEDKLQFEKLQTIIDDNELDEQLLLFVASDTLSLNNKFKEYFLNLKNIINIELQNDLFKSILTNLEHFENKCIVINLFEQKEYQNFLDEFQFKRDYIPQKKLKFIFLLNLEQYENFKVKAYDFFSFGDFFHDFKEVIFKEVNFEVNTDKLNSMISEYEEVKKTNISNSKKIKDLLQIAYEAEKVFQYRLALEYLEKAQKIAAKKKDFFNLIVIISKKCYVFARVGAYENGIEELKDVLQIAKKIQYIDGEINIYNVLAYIYRRIGCYNIALRYCKKILKFAKNKDDIIQIAIAKEYMGIVYMDIGEYKESLDYIQDALNIFKQNKEKKKLLNCSISISHLYIKMYNFDSALLYLNNALRVSKELKEKEMMIWVYGNFGSLYGLTGDLLLSLEYHKKSLQIAQEIDLKPQMAEIYFEIGKSYLYKNNFDDSILNINFSLQMNETMYENDGIGKCYHCLAHIYLEKKIYNKSLEYLKKAMDKYIELDNSYDILQCNIDFGIYYTRIGNNGKSKEILLQVLQEIEGKNYIENEINIYNNLAATYIKENNYLKAKQYLDKALTLSQQYSLNILKMEVLYNFGYFYEKQNELKKALQNYKKSLKLYQYIDNEIKLKEIEEKIINLEKEVKDA